MSTTSGETEKDEKKEVIEYPNIVERFKEVFQKLGIKKFEAYVDHCAKGELEDLDDIEEKLYEMGLHPSLRNQVVYFWATEIKKPIPKNLQKRLAEERGATPREEVDEKEDPAKYSVDTATGAIKVASSTDKALTWDEAEKLSKDMDARLKRESGGEPIFILGETGAWTLNPKAKVGTNEFAVFQMYQESLRRGEPIDPVEELTKREEQMARLKSAMGVKEGDSEITLLDKLDRLGMLKKGEGEGGLLAQMDSLGLLRKSGEEGSTTQIELLDKLNALGLLKTPGGEGESSKFTALLQEFKEFKETAQKQEMDNVKTVVASIGNQMTEMRKEIANGGRLEGRYALMEKTINTIDNQLSGIRSDAKPLLAGIAGGGREPSKKSPEERARIAKGLKEAVTLEKRARELENDLLFGGKPQS